jgi:photosystem II stability/assembly factor-like uncharacterized protein
MTDRTKIAAAIRACALLILIALYGCSEKPAGPAKLTLVVDPTFMTQTVICNQGVGGRKINVQSSGREEIIYTATNSEPWLSLSNASDTTPSTVFVNFHVSGLNVGVYVDTVVITSPLASNTVKIEVQLTVGSLVTVSPGVLIFRGLLLAGNPAPQEIVLTDICDSGYSYTVIAPAPWLSLSRDSGAAPDTIRANVDVTGLPIGVYTDIITIEAPQAVNSPLDVVCTLTVSSWLPQNNVITHDLRGVTFVDEHHGWAVGIIEPSPDSAGYITATTDGGQHWGDTGQVFTSEKLGDVVFVDANTGWAVGSGGCILHTSNSGASWSKQISGTPNDLWGVTFIDPDTGWAVGRDGIILHTTNGGAAWAPQLSNTDKDLSAVTFVNFRHGWIVGNASTILHTTNGGAVWTLQSSLHSSDLRDVFFSDTATGWAVGSGGTILHTTDSGNTWSVLATNTANQLEGVTFSSTGHGWVVGKQGTILHTVDGITWTPQTSGNDKWLFDVSFSDDNIGWAVGAEGVIIHTVSGGE